MSFDFDFDAKCRNDCRVSITLYVCGGVFDGKRRELSGMAIDWGATGAMLQGIGTLAGAAAVFLGAIIGARTWKNQKIAERRFEAAERILTATYNARAALAQVRDLLMYPHERSIAKETLKEEAEWGEWTKEERERRIVARAYHNRLDRTIDEQIALDECLPMAHALFGKRLEAAMKTLIRQFSDIKRLVSIYVIDQGDDPELTDAIKQAMNELPTRNNQTNERTDAIAKAVKDIEKECEPALRLEPIRQTKAR